MDHAISLLPKEWHATRREGRRKEVEGPSIAVCSNKGCPIQKRLLPPVPKVFRPRRSKVHHERGSRGDLRKPFRGTIISAQAYSSRILLAHHAEGQASLCQSLRQVSKVQQCHLTTVRGTHPYDNPIAIRSMGVRYHGSFPNSNQVTEVPSSQHRLLHEMGRSRNLSHHHRKEYTELRMEEHSL